MKTVNQVSKLTGISVRMLHYYDKMGLFKPSKLSESGYRLYSDDDLETLQQILFFKELDFPLKEIKSIMNSPEFDREKALKNHKSMLILKRDRLNKLIKLVERTLKGEREMNFKEFDTSKIEEAQKKYEEEVKEMYQNTEAYKEYKIKTANYSKEDMQRIFLKMENIFKKFAEVSQKNAPDSVDVQNLVRKWQKFITDNYYECTDEILKGLGKMYIADERFKNNIDKYGENLSVFISKAIEFYCK